MPTGVYVRTKEHRQQISRTLKGVPKSKEMKLNLSKARQGIAGTRTGIKLPNEVKRKISNSLLGHIVSEETKNKIRNTIKTNWLDEKYREKHIKFIPRSEIIGQTKPEKELQQLLNKLFPNEYKYVGDGSVWIGFKNPDFINIYGQKKIIELFGDYWHSRKVTGLKKKVHRKQRQEHFAKYGYQTCVVWEKELKDIPALKGKIQMFHQKEKVDI